MDPDDKAIKQLIDNINQKIDINKDLNDLSPVNPSSMSPKIKLKSKITKTIKTKSLINGLNEQFLNINNNNDYSSGPGGNGIGSDYSSNNYSSSKSDIDADDEYNENDDDDESVAILSALSTSIEPQKPIDTPLTKCCASFWVLFKYIAILFSFIWILFLFVILFQKSMDNIRSIIQYIDPVSSSIKPIHHKLVNNNCFTYNSDKLAQSFNVYLVFHFIRWFLYCLIYRNRLILWINSVLWELIQFFIASITVFNLSWIGQCWYDSVIVDILIINMLGIELGIIIIKNSNICIMYNKFNDIFKCKISTFKSFIIVWIVIFLFQLQQLLMFIIFDQTFYYNTYGWLIWCRFIVYLFIQLYSVNQLYQWINLNNNNEQNIKNKSKIKSLSFVIILNILVFVELLIAIKTYSLQSSS